MNKVFSWLSPVALSSRTYSRAYVCREFFRVGFHISAASVPGKQSLLRHSSSILFALSRFCNWPTGIPTAGITSDHGPNQMGNVNAKPMAVWNSAFSCLISRTSRRTTNKLPMHCGASEIGLSGMEMHPARRTFNAKAKQYRFRFFLRTIPSPLNLWFRSFAQWSQFEKIRKNTLWPLIPA